MYLLEGVSFEGGSSPIVPKGATWVMKALASSSDINLVLNCHHNPMYLSGVYT